MKLFSNVVLAEWMEEHFIPPVYGGNMSQTNRISGVYESTDMPHARAVRYGNTFIMIVHLSITIISIMANIYEVHQNIIKLRFPQLRDVISHA